MKASFICANSWIEKIEFYEFLIFIKFAVFYKTINSKIYKIQIITFIAAKFQQTVANTAPNFWISNFVMSTVQDSLTRQQLNMIMSSLLQSLRITYSFIVFPSVSI